MKNKIRLRLYKFVFWLRWGRDFCLKIECSWEKSTDRNSLYTFLWSLNFCNQRKIQKKCRVSEGGWSHWEMSIWHFAECSAHCRAHTSWIEFNSELCLGRRLACVLFCSKQSAEALFPVLVRSRIKSHTCQEMQYFGFLQPLGLSYGAPATSCSCFLYSTPSGQWQFNLFEWN